MKTTTEMTDRELDIAILLLLFPKAKVFYQDYDTDQEWPEWIPSGKSKRTHMIDAVGVPRYTSDLNHAFEALRKSTLNYELLNMPAILMDEYPSVRFHGMRHRITITPPDPKANVEDARGEQIWNPLAIVFGPDGREARTICEAMKKALEALEGKEKVK